jgi:exonuclease VII large subunit
MLGTGIYLDDVDTALQRIDARASANIERTMSWLTAIALTGAAAIAVCALVLNVSESRSADAKLKQLAQRVVESQEQERERLSRELHDGISQMMVSAKLMLESALARFERGATRMPAAEQALASGIGRLGDTLREVRRISHALRPAMLDDLGLAAALEQLVRELGEQSGIDIGYTQVAHSGARPLPAPSTRRCSDRTGSAQQHRASCACVARGRHARRRRACGHAEHRRQRLRLRCRAHANRRAPRNRAAQHARAPRRARRHADDRVAGRPYRRGRARAAARRRDDAPP